jgi:hypothetical protein
MPETTANLAVETLRSLVADLGAIEEMIDAHGFAFANLNATIAEATAVFDRSPAWSLVFCRAAESGDVKVLLRGLDKKRPPVSLSLSVDADGLGTLAEATGLALSFTTLYDRPPSAV